MGEAVDVIVDAVELRVLRQVAESAFAVHDAGVSRCATTEDAQQARLPGSVAADETDLVAGADREVDVLDEHSPGDLDGQPPHLQHGDMLTAVLEAIGVGFRPLSPRVQLI